MNGAATQFGRRLGARTPLAWSGALLAAVWLWPGAEGLLAREPSSLERAAAAYRQRDVQEALRYARRAIQEEPENPQAHALLGELYYLQQDLSNARACWQKALKLDPGLEELRRKLEQLDREQPIEEQLARLEVHPFRVRFASAQVPLSLEALREILRQAYRSIGQTFDYFPDRSIPVLLYSEEDFEKVKALSHQVAGLYDGKIRLPVRPGLFQGRDSDRADELTRILWHEYTHAVIHDLAKGRCPLWLNEGIATVQESRVRRVEVDAAKAALEQGTLPPLESLWASAYGPADRLPLFYQTSFLLVQYLVKRWGWRELVSLLKRLGQGVPLPEAVEAQYRLDLATLEKQWRAWLRQNL